MKPDFNTMSQKEHREYVLQNRNDDEAIRAYFARPDLKWITVPPQFDEDGKPIEENIKLAEEMFKKHINRDRSEE